MWPCAKQAYMLRWGRWNPSNCFDVIHKLLGYLNLLWSIPSLMMTSCCVESEVRLLRREAALLAQYNVRSSYCRFRCLLYSHICNLKACLSPRRCLRMYLCRTQISHIAWDVLSRIANRLAKVSDHTWVTLKNCVKHKIKNWVYLWLTRKRLPHLHRGTQDDLKSKPQRIFH